MEAIFFPLKKTNKYKWEPDEFHKLLTNTQFQQTSCLLSQDSGALINQIVGADIYLSSITVPAEWISMISPLGRKESKFH